MECVLERPYVLLHEGKISNVQKLLPLREAAKTRVQLDEAGANELLRQAGLGEAAEHNRYVDAMIQKLRVKPLVAPPESNVMS